MMMTGALATLVLICCIVGIGAAAAGTTKARAAAAAPVAPAQSLGEEWKASHDRYYAEACPLVVETRVNELIKFIKEQMAHAAKDQQKPPAHEIDMLYRKEWIWCGDPHGGKVVNNLNAFVARLCSPKLGLIVSCNASALVEDKIPVPPSEDAAGEEIDPLAQPAMMTIMGVRIKIGMRRPAPADGTTAAAAKQCECHDASPVPTLVETPTIMRADL